VAGLAAGSSQPTAPIGIVVVNYGSHDLIEANLGKLDLDQVTATVVVVDNLSTAAERREMAAVAASNGWEFLPLPDNRGFGAGCNAGVRHAAGLGCTCFLLVNPDAVVTAELVSALRDHCLREPDALVTPRIVDSAGSVVFAGSQLVLSTGQLRGRCAAIVDAPAEPWLTAACLAGQVTAFSRIGGFDESYFLYWEDVDFSYRAHQAGTALIVRDDLTAVHDEGGTQGPREGRAKSATYYYFNSRNRLLFAVRNLSRGSVLRWIACTPAASWEVLLRGGRRQLRHPRRTLWPVIRGSLAGLAIAVRSLATGAGAPARRPATMTGLTKKGHRPAEESGATQGSAGRAGR
jgi:GT2 family glycosyltransferase